MAGRGNEIARGHSHLRYRHTIETKRALATLAKEMHMQIVVLIATMAMTQLITQRPDAILDGVHQMVFSEKGNGAENTRLVDT